MYSSKEHAEYLIIHLILFSGILETQPICFESVSTSKGSSVEKVNLQSGSKHAAVEEESTEPVIGNDALTSITDHPPHHLPTVSR